MHDTATTQNEMQAVASVPNTPTSGHDETLPVHATGGVNQNPADIGLFALLREDLKTHDGKLFEQGFWAIAVHRYGNWRMGIKPKLLRLPFSLVYKVLNKHVEWLCGISLPDTVKVGRRVRLWHHGGMILHAASIGDEAQIRQNTTFGVVRTEHNFEMPVIGARADIGCGACVLGPVTVGEGSVVGANAVVLKDIPAHSVAVGIPAKVVKTLTPETPGHEAGGQS